MVASCCVSSLAPSKNEEDSSVSFEALKMQLRSERQLNNKLACKVDMLSAMAAMKDELMRVTDERFAALKWEVLHNFHGDQQKFQQMTDKLGQCVDGWPPREDDENSAQVVAPLVVFRKDLLLSKLKDNVVSTDTFATALVECLPEFRRDFLIRLVQNYGSSTVKVDDFTGHCEQTFARSLKVLSIPGRADRLQTAAADAVADISTPNNNEQHQQQQRPLPPEAPPPPPPQFHSEQVAQPPAALPLPQRQDAAAPAAEKLPTKRAMWWRKKAKGKRTTTTTPPPEAPP